MRVHSGKFFPVLNAGFVRYAEQGVKVRVFIQISVFRVPLARAVMQYGEETTLRKTRRSGDGATLLHHRLLQE